MNISLKNLSMFIIVVIYVVLNGIHGQSYQPVNFKPSSTGRRLLYSDWESAPSFYSPGGITPDNEPRAPIYMELTNNLTSVNGASGICGVCARIYRVLHMTQLNAAEECRRHHNSRQAAFGDITEFYHTVSTLYILICNKTNHLKHLRIFCYLFSVKCFLTIFDTVLVSFR